jgi:polyphosphate glucokinase
MQILGIDIGGSGIKGAPVEVETGKLTAERFRIATPHPSKPEAMADVVAEIVKHFEWKGPIGCTFPAVVKKGVTLSAANVDRTWIGTNVQSLFRRKTHCPVLVLNDADAAGIAEMQFGAGKNKTGVVIILTFGTGIGSAVFYNGVLLPNTEFGHMEVRGRDAEKRASARVRTEKELNWKQWAARVTEVLNRLEILFTPDLFIIGGGVSKDYDEFLPMLETSAKVVPAKLFNEAGIVGAALAAKGLAEK